MNRWFCLMLLLILCALQQQLWWGGASLPALFELEHRILQLQTSNAYLTERNQLLTAEILELKQGLDAVEERARNELGMIQKGEIFVWIVPPK